jgi:hypothetical protein
VTARPVLRLVAPPLAGNSADAELDERELYDMLRRLADVAETILLGRHPAPRPQLRLIK